MFRGFYNEKKKRCQQLLHLFYFAGAFYLEAFCLLHRIQERKSLCNSMLQSIVIQEGDSLWSLAERHIDSESETAVKEYIKELKQINQLESEPYNRRTFDHPVLHNRISTIMFYYHTDIIYTPMLIDINSLQKECCQADRAYLYCSIPFL